jgi:YVTN family beta-propeller protein
VLRPVPSVLALNPAGTILYVLGAGDTILVSLVDTATNVVSRIEAGLDPVAVDFSPDGTKAYIANQGDNTVSIFDTTTFPPTKITDMEVGQGPRSLVVSPDGTKVHVANFLDNTISVISTAAGEPIQAQSIIFVPWIGPWNILLDPGSVETSEPQALVINRTSNEVGILNLSTDEPESTVPVGTNPEEGAFDPELLQAVVTNFGSNDISFFDTTGTTESFSVPVGLAPVAVAVAPSGKLCDLLLSVADPRVRAGGTLEFTLALQHNRLRTLTVPLKLWVESAAGERIVLVYEEIHTLKTGDRIDRSDSVELPGGMALGLYYLVVDARGMSGVGRERVPFRVWEPTGGVE